jgi:hypothetical protein
MSNGNSERDTWLRRRNQGWASALAKLASGALLFLTLTGLSVWLLPFSLFNQHAVLAHTVLGLVALPPLALYLTRHVRAYGSIPLSHPKLTGWLAGILLAICCLSGVVLTWQAVFGTRIEYAWRLTHQVTTVGLVLFGAVHYGTLVARERKRRADPELGVAYAHARAHGRTALATLAAGLLLVGALCVGVRPPSYVHEFPPDYERAAYEGAGPFAPSLAMTSTGGAFDARALSGSERCGTSGCHQQIVEEWRPSAHRYAAKDIVFQGIQGLMAQQNGAPSTRYCAGCHDPISLFSGEKSFAAASLTGKAGLDEGVSCLVCHAIEKTDVKGNASYVIHEPERYVWEHREGPLARLVGDFVMRAYPDHHVASLSKRMFKTPEFCAACHKQFIDEAVNKVGWVQLQNQYDNWKASRWNHPGSPGETLECRECHMPLLASSDPAAGDDADFNRTLDDGKHRSHRFLGANQFIPRLQELPGGDEHCRLVERWLRGDYEVPEIAARWRPGPAVPIEIEAPAVARPGESVALAVHLLNNKVGHDFPTGPLDIIQSWVEIVVTDAKGRTVFETGAVDEKHFIDTGTFMFKAEPVDRYGNLIDRHNLWEMVGVRFKRALFPGQTDVARFDFPCPAAQGASVQDLQQKRDYEIAIPPDARGVLSVEARLRYRKVDQYLISFAFGPDSEVTSPITDISSARAEIRVATAPSTGSGGSGGGGR